LILRSCGCLYEYERGAVFTLGKYTSTRGPGLTFIVPILQSMRKVDLRTLQTIRDIAATRRRWMGEPRSG